MRFLALFGLFVEPLPPESDAGRFMDAAVKACASDASSWTFQTERCREHLLRLHHLRSVRGWEGGIQDDALADTEFCMNCWEALCSSLEDNGDKSSLHARRMLARYKRLVGAASYKSGWVPLPIPPAEKFQPLYPSSLSVRPNINPLP